MMKRVIGLLMFGLASTACAAPNWPTPTNEMRPWVYNWWMGNAVDAAGLRQQAADLQSAGFGGAHAIGIYEARDPKHPGTPFLSEEWTRRFNTAVATNAVYGLGTDLSMGCGWCFGGPWITPELGVWSLRRETNPRRLPRNAQILWQGRTADGKQPLILAAVPARTAVKRTAAADRGLMLDPFSPDAMRTHLAPFTKAFDRPGAAKPRAIYHDSFEYYGASWTPKLFEAFLAKRGYDLRAHLPALAGIGTPDEIRRIKHDYRETLSDLQVDTFRLWVDWCRARGIETRNEAHGTPANWLDLYALADIPETEMFNTDRDILVSKFASSPAHLKGTPRVASESCTWIGEHFTSTLGDVKIFLDQLLLSGVTEVFYHGCCYTPADVAWPGWSFYASLEMNPRNPLWHDMDIFNAGLTRCQSLAQKAKPDEDVLIYWPIHDTWRDPDGFAKMMSVHNSSEWFAKAPFGRLARRLWNEGVSFDYISDRQLAMLNKTSHWKTIYIPACETLPLETAKQLAQLSKKGWKIVFDGPRPQDVPGWKNAAQERAELRKVLATIPVIKGAVPLRREPFNPSKGLAYRRFKMGRDTLYYVVNQSEKTVSGSYRPSVPIAKSCLLWPLTGTISRSQRERSVVTFSLAAHESIWVWITPQPKGSVPPHPAPSTSLPAPSTKYQAPSTQHQAPIPGPWTVTPIVGGPSLTWSRVMTNLVTWSRHADGSENPFSGTVRYQTTFLCPKTGWTSIDFGDVRDSARLFVNGQLVGGRFMKPYHFNVPSNFLRVGKNELVLEVTNTGANRLRDVDQRKVPWKHFADINVVGRDYRPFNAAKWPLRDAGLLGPVTYTIKPYPVFPRPQDLFEALLGRPAEAKEHALPPSEKWALVSSADELLADWLLQDGGFGVRENPFTVTNGEARVEAALRKVGVPVDTLVSWPERFAAYRKICEARRAKRLAKLVAFAPRWVYARHRIMGGSHYAYTEAVSDTKAEHFFPEHPSSLVLAEATPDGLWRETPLLEVETGCFRDVDVSLDGTRVLYSFKASGRADDFHLYELDLRTKTVRQLTHGAGFADYEGCYLPNGDILFNSTRCVQIVDCANSDVSNLFRCDANGGNITRVTFDQVHDNFPALTWDGQILYTRWEYNDRSQIFPQPLFRMACDGTGQRAVYGDNSWYPTTLIHARAVPKSPLIFAIATGHHTFQPGEVVRLDPRAGRQEAQGVWTLGPLAQAKARRIDADGQAGRIAAYPYPIDERELVLSFLPEGWKTKRVNRYTTDEEIDYREVFAPMGFYWMDIDGAHEQLTLRWNGVLPCGRMVPVRARREIAARPSQVDRSKTTGTVYVQDVYQGEAMKGVVRGTVKTIRVVALDYRPANCGINGNSGPGGGAGVTTPISLAQGAWDPKIPLGDVAIEADGSAFFEAPAETPFYLMLLDEKGRMVQTMRSWMTLQRGENASCTGCHESKNDAPPAPATRPRALQTGVRKLTPVLETVRGFSFLKDVQPILDRRCVSCHGPDAKERPDLSNTLVDDPVAGRRWTRGYLSLTHAFYANDLQYWRGNPDHPQVNWVSPASVPTLLAPLSFGANRSQLFARLDKGHAKGITDAEIRTLAMWVDFCVPFCGTYDESALWTPEQRADYDKALEKRRRAFDRK